MSQAASEDTAQYSRAWVHGLGPGAVLLVALPGPGDAAIEAARALLSAPAMPSTEVLDAAADAASHRELVLGSWPAGAGLEAPEAALAQAELAGQSVAGVLILSSRAEEVSHTLPLLCRHEAAIVGALPRLTLRVPVPDYAAGTRCPAAALALLRAACGALDRLARHPGLEAEAEAWLHGADGLARRDPRVATRISRLERAAAREEHSPAIAEQLAEAFQGLLADAASETLGPDTTKPPEVPGASRGPAQ